MNLCYGRFYFLYVGNCFMKHLINKINIIFEIIWWYTKERMCKYIIWDIVHNNGMDWALTHILEVCPHFILYYKWINFSKISQNSGLIRSNCFIKICWVTYCDLAINELEAILSVFWQSKSMNSMKVSLISDQFDLLLFIV